MKRKMNIKEIKTALIMNAVEVIKWAGEDDIRSCFTPINRMYKIKILMNKEDKHGS